MITDCAWNQAKEVTADSLQSRLRKQAEMNDKRANDYLEGSGASSIASPKLVASGQSMAALGATNNEEKAKKLPAIIGESHVLTLAVASSQKLGDSLATKTQVAFA